MTNDPAIRIDTAKRTTTLRSGRVLNYGALLLATGAEPRSLTIEGAGLSHVFRLRTFADSKAIIARAAQVKQAVVIGASFIGLEVAASLRHRGLEVTPEILDGPRSLALDQSENRMYVQKAILHTLF